jgi:hypothetical protein
MPEEAATALKASESCYVTQAKRIGSESCQPPPYLVGAVFGACADLDGALKVATQHAYSMSYEMASNQVEWTHTQMTNFIQAIILAAQTKVRKCP